MADDMKSYERPAPSTHSVEHKHMESQQHHPLPQSPPPTRNISLAWQSGPGSISNSSREKLERVDIAPARDFSSLSAQTFENASDLVEDHIPFGMPDQIWDSLIDEDEEPELGSAANPFSFDLETEEDIVQPEPSLLLSLPPELRVHICAYVLVSVNPLVIGTRSTGSVGLLEGPPHITAVLQTCHQLRNECTRLFYKRNKFQIQDGDSWVDDGLRHEARVTRTFLLALSEAARSSIDYIHVRLNRWPCNDQHFQSNILETIVTLADIRAEAESSTLTFECHIHLWKITCYCGYHVVEGLGSHPIIIKIDLSHVVSSLRMEAQRLHGDYLANPLTCQCFGLAANRLRNLAEALEKHYRRRWRMRRLRQLPRRRTLD